MEQIGLREFKNMEVRSQIVWYEGKERRVLDVYWSNEMRGAVIKDGDEIYYLRGFGQNVTVNEVLFSIGMYERKIKRVMYAEEEYVVDMRVKEVCFHVLEMV
jgi:hypothetical protein